MVIWGGLKNSWEKKRSERQRRKERYIHLNPELQRRERRDKKAFLSDQCKEIEENNRLGKTRDLKKIRDTKETFHAQMGSIKDRNGMDLIEAEDIKKRWQKYTERERKRPVAQSCATLCDPMNRSTPGLPVYHQLPEFTETHVHWVSEVKFRAVEYVTAEAREWNHVTINKAMPQPIAVGRSKK